MQNYLCNNCLEAFTQDKIIHTMNENEFNDDDKTLYEVEVCPYCKSNDIEEDNQ